MTSTAWESPPDATPGDDADRVTCRDCGDHYHAADPKGPGAGGRCGYCHVDLDRALRTCRICDGRDGQHGPGCQYQSVTPGTSTAYPGHVVVESTEVVCPRLAYVRALFAAGRDVDAIHFATTDEPLPVRP